MSVRANIDREAIVAAAAELTDQYGSQPITLAQIAVRLGVRSPSLYNHVSGLADVHQGLAARAMRELLHRLVRAAVGKSAGDAIRSMGRAYREFAKAHPGLYQATLRAPDPSQPELSALSRDLVDTVQTVLEPFALSPDEATHAIRAFRSLLHGFVSLETSGGFALELSLDDSFEHLIDVFLHGLA